MANDTGWMNGWRVSESNVIEAKDEKLKFQVDKNVRTNVEKALKLERKKKTYNDNDKR